MPLNLKLDMPLYPSEEQIAKAVMGDRAREWRAKASFLELHSGFPPIDPFYGGRFWPAVIRWFDAKNGVVNPSSGDSGAAPPLAPPLHPDEETFDVAKETAAGHQRRDRRFGRARS